MPRVSCAARTARATASPARCRHQCVGTLDDLGEPEVGQLDARIVVVRLEQDVLGLEVAVNNALGVHVRDRRRQLSNDLARLTLAIPLLLTDAIEELAARDQLQHDEKVLLLREEVVHAHEVGVILQQLLCGNFDV